MSEPDDSKPFPVKMIEGLKAGTPATRGSEKSARYSSGSGTTSRRKSPGRTNGAATEIA